MKNLYFSLVLLCALSFSATAETWNGSMSSDWNTASNWTPATVPTATSAVSIPTFGITNYPQLTSNITIERFAMSSGAKLDVNGFSVTVLGGAGNNTFVGDTISNSASGTNIIFNMASASGYSSRISRCVFTDTVTFNISGLGYFYEGYSSIPNIFNHDVSYNINTTANVYTSYISETVHLGNLTVNRTLPGFSAVFQDGGVVAGNFSYTNMVGGETRIGGASANQLTTINGQVDIMANDTSTSPFIMRRIKNLTTGGTINVQGSRGFSAQYDTLFVNSISLSDYSGNAYAYFYDNDITGNVNISPDSSYSGGYSTIVRGCIITGTTTFSNPSSNAFYETFSGNSGNVYNGNTIVNGNGSGRVELGYSVPSTYNGNLSVHRTVAGITAIFKNGSTVNGNFDYTNNTSGTSDVGNFSTPTLISGTINIDMDLMTPAPFRLYNITNQTGGGVISVKNTVGFEIQRDTLLVDTISITDYQGAAYANLYDNQITGDIVTSSDSSYIGGYTTRIRRNNISGNSQFIINSSNAVNEANANNASNVFNGNTSFIANGTGEIRLGWNDTSTYNGNLSITRNVAGTSTIFGSGAQVNGNFSYTNTAGGSASFGFTNYPTFITGTIDLLVDYPTPATFQMLEFTNQTTGGVIDVRGTQGFNFRNDSFKVASLTFAEYKGAAYARLYESEIIGDVTISDDSTYTGGYNTDLRDNAITGNTVASLNGTNAFQSAYSGTQGNIFTGNTIFNANGSGTLRVSGFYSSTFNGDLTVNRTADGQTRVCEGGGTINGNFVLNNMATGPVYLGSGTNPTLITGTIDVSVNDTTPAVFGMNQIANQTSGGVINILNTRGASINNNSLKVTTFNLSGFTGASNTNVYDNQIEGVVNIHSDSSYVSYFVALARNTFIGTTTLTNDGTNVFYDAGSANEGNTYEGDLLINEGQGSIRMGWQDTSSVSGDLLFNTNGTLVLGDMLFNGNTNTVVDQLGTQALEFDKLIMDKTGANLSLNTPVTIDEDIVFGNGNVINTATNKLTILDNGTATGASNTSHVDGVVSKIGNDAFIFPIGKNNKYAPLGISAPASNTDEFTAEYFEAMPHTSGFDSSMKDASIDHISHNEYWICDRTAGTSNVDVTLSWDASLRSGTVNNLGDLLVCRWDGTAWKDEGQASNTGTFSNGTVTSNLVTNFSPFTLGSSTANNPLPVNLLTFEAIQQAEMTRLVWTTENERDLSHYEVERSRDGIHFESLGAINATDKEQYELFDEQPLEGLNYYRLKMLDIDGQFSFSEIRTLNFIKNVTLTFYPNPVQDVIYFNADEEIKSLEIYDATSRLIEKIEANNVVQYDMSALPQGIYFIKLHQEHIVESLKILKD